MIIAQLSDTHIALDTLDAERRLRDFELAVADINALDPPVNAVVHTGDVVHNGRKDEYDAAAAVLARLRAPVYVLPGNKDDRANLRETFSASGYLGSNADFIQYAIDDFPLRLIALDTLKPGSNKGAFCDARARHFIDLIDADTTKPIAVFAHHPPFEVLEGPEPWHFETPEAMARLRDAVQHSERIVAVVSGHVHRGVSGDVGGVPASVMPSIATTLRYGEYPPPMKGRTVYHLHRFDPGIGFTTEARVVTK